MVKLKESEKKGKYLDLARKLTNRWDMKVTAIPIYLVLLVQSRKICKRTREHVNKRTSGDNPNYSIVELCQNTVKSPGDLLSQTFQEKTIGITPKTETVRE